MSRKTIDLDDRLYSYLLDHSLREPPLLAELREETGRMAQAQMQIAPEQGQLIDLLLRLIGATKTLEIGVFTGYSTLVTAQALPADGRVVACDTSEEWTAVARRYWDRAGVSDRIDLRLGPALDTLDGLLHAGERDHYDFAFVDADKENYSAYYERCLQLVRPGGLIAFDNTLWSGRVADPASEDADTLAIRRLNHQLHLDERIDLSLLPVADGLSLARRR